MDTYFLVLLGSGLNNEKQVTDQCSNTRGLQKGFDIIADKILEGRGNNRHNERNCLQDPLLFLLEGRRRKYFAVGCSQYLEDEIQELDLTGTSLDVFNNSDWTLVDDKTLSQTQETIRMLASRYLDKSVSDQNELRIKEDGADEDDDHDGNDDDDDDHIADNVHQLADLLPSKGGAVITVYWILPDQPDLTIMNTLPLFGALKRLQHCNNAMITILTTNKITSDSFLDSWKKWLKFSPLVMTNTVAMKDVPLWHGSLTCVGLQRNSSIVLPGFTLTSASNKQLETDLTFEESDCLSDNSTCNITYLMPEIQMLKYIPRMSVPLYLLLPIKLKLNLEYNDETLSLRFMEDLHSSCDKGLGLLACLSMTTKPEENSQVPTLESWMDYVTSSSHLRSSQDPPPVNQVSGFSSDFPPDVKRLCMIYSKGLNDVDVYLFRQPKSLNGKIYEYLQSITRGKKVIDYENDTKLHVQDVSNMFLDAEKESYNSCTKEVPNQIEKSKDNMSLPHRKSLHLVKKIDIDLSSTIEHILQSDLNVPPAQWPERLWLTQNDPTELAAREAKKKAPIPIEEVLSMDGKDILKRFHSDGKPIRQDLSPLRSAYKTEAKSHILINTTEESIRRARYPEVLLKKYHGVEYCLDSHDALSKDIQIARTQTSVVKQETQSSCTTFNSKRLETLSRNVQRVTRSRNQERSTDRPTVPSRNQTRSKKRASPPAKRNNTRQSAKRKRAESPNQEEDIDEEKVDPSKTKETRSQRHKRRLRLVVEKTLSEHGIDKKHDLYASCTERLYSLIKSFLKDLKSSHGLNDTMKDLARSNVEQVINFEKTRVKK